MTMYPPANVLVQKKSCSVNPLKSSAPLGAAMAFMGMDRCQPLFHGSQGCTAFGLVLLVRHFKEAIPFQTTAMNEITTILGGIDNVEQALVNVAKRAKPALIGICSTGLTETRGEDVAPELRLIRQRNPELQDTAVVYASTPDYVGGMQEGWAKAVSAIIEAFVPARNEAAPLTPIRGQVNILAGVHLTAGDLEELREITDAFGLEAIILPDLSGSLDGHVPDTYCGTSYGGTSLEDVACMGASVATLAFGEHMRKPAEDLEAKTGVPSRLVLNATGIEGCDRLMVMLSEISGRPIPPRFRRQRSQLVDAMLDAHFHFGGKTVVMAAEPDLLLAYSTLFNDLGAVIPLAVSTVSTPSLQRVPAATVQIGDLEDLELGAKEHHADLLVTHSHGRQASARTGIPLYRVGFPQFDRLGSAHRATLGYRASRDIVFEVGNLFIEAMPNHLLRHGHDDHGDHSVHHEGACGCPGTLEASHGCSHSASC
ncbi:nitrogenase iron-molybdenum cofactor biosynthesis protein NifN [Insolitispirillum peregrinum]|uniref:nitrogenase iron-molybdenum cofactor biosynthesis protein NifN n=1 Tax=Insolitispirillum peregrinum TaxID=80876 RepID=UPI00361731B5